VFPGDAFGGESEWPSLVVRECVPSGPWPSPAGRVPASVDTSPASAAGVPSSLASGCAKARLDNNIASMQQNNTRHRIGGEIIIDILIRRRASSKKQAF
jgi:hypothetical protein